MKIAMVLIYAGILFTLVRPGSKGPQLISGLFSGTKNSKGQSNNDGLVGLLSASMGGGQDKNNNWASGL